ncbi:hypothetical protein FYK55_03650 [Roseiconus nitratireducens]|uniref:Uncharacterized protein n=1 Tax=Roseiconus nitratireducens TaxID=2605748 RepID=A0A5M6DIH1_9BACT|nr:hypothetical protein [Roseiconus nitratireducens]KAA5546012.1 hypothetical protein FYK55_03650 [Roseiconus nitratireducens]
MNGSQPDERQDQKPNPYDPVPIPDQNQPERNRASSVGWATMALLFILGAWAVRFVFGLRLDPLIWLLLLGVGCIIAVIAIFNKRSGK